MMTVALMMLAIVAPTLAAADVDHACDKWLKKLSIHEGQVIKTQDSPDKWWCRKECMNHSGCEAVTFKKKKCSLYKLDGTSMLHQDKDADSFVFCGKCNKNENKTLFKGGHEIMTVHTKDFWWCRKKCMHTSKCNAFVWHAQTKSCTMRDVHSGHLERVSNKAFTSYIFCDEKDVLPMCGGTGHPSCFEEEEEAAVCGGKGQRICYEGQQCEDGLSINEKGICTCGGKWQTCCGDGKCADGLACDNNGGNKYGQCSPCGGDESNDYQVCCPNKECNQDDQRRVCLSNGGCAPCGGLFQQQCHDEPKCEGMLMPDMHGGTQCMMAGQD